jgi:hypothetical protein
MTALATPAFDAGAICGEKASIERATALNVSKLALLATAERSKKRGEYQRCYCAPGEPAFYIDLPFRVQPLDKRHGPHVFLPLHRKYKLLGTNYDDHVPDYDDHAGLAWRFRRDPREIEGAWSPKQDYFIYTSSDYGKSRNETSFLNEYRRRLRILLAEAVPGVGGLAALDTGTEPLGPEKTHRSGGGRPRREWWPWYGNHFTRSQSDGP